jgi:protein-S-isoprenylcysteine O-methyltransferase Ste14
VITVSVGIITTVDRTTHVTVGGFVAGLIVGLGVGWLWATFRQGWRAASGSKKLAAAAQRGAWLQTRHLIGLGFLLAVVAALALGNLR